MLKINLSSSRQLLYGLIAAHVAAAGSLIVLDVPLLIKVAAVSAIAASLAFYVWRIALLRGPGSIVAMEFREGAKVAFQTRCGKWHACRLLGSSFVSSYLTILNLDPEGARMARHVVIAPDSLDSEDFRQLRVWLRWKSH